MKFTEHVTAREKGKIRLDLGSGTGLKPVLGPDGPWRKGSYVRVDKYAHKEVDKVADLTRPWPWKNASVDEVSSDYLLHLLSPKERVHFMNELYRVLKPGGTAVIITPNWATSKAFIDARYAPVTEAWYFSLSKKWREEQNYIDKSGFRCNFEDPVFGYGLHPAIATRNLEYQQHAISFWKEAAQDLVVTLTKK